MKYLLKIYESTNNKDYKLTNVLTSAKKEKVLIEYIKALREYAFKKRFYNVIKSTYNQKIFSKIEIFTTIYEKIYGNDKLYYKYEYIFENVDLNN